MDTFLTWAPVPVFVYYLARVVPIWLEKTHLRGMVYAYRRSARSFVLLRNLNVWLFATDVAQLVFVDFTWWELLPAFVNLLLIPWSEAQRQLALARMHHAEAREVRRTEIPDSPEGLV